MVEPLDSKLLVQVLGLHARLYSDQHRLPLAVDQDGQPIGSSGSEDPDDASADS